MTQFDVIVVGGGPAGLFAALHVGRNQKVLLLEKNHRPGKKLLMSGSGRCNLTHSGDIQLFQEHYGANFRFLRNALNTFSNEDLMGYFNKRRLPTTIDKNGKVFPAVGDAGSLLNILLDQCQKQKVRLQTNKAVSKIENLTDTSAPGFRVHTPGGIYTTRHLVLAVGGKSYPASGSSGDGFIFAQSLGHTVVTPKPALTPVYVKAYRFATISGVSLPHRMIYLYRGNKKIKEHQGDVGFTHKGLSGPGILDFSRYMERNDTIKLAVAAQNEAEFSKRFMETVAGKGKISIKGFLKGFDIPVSLIELILQQLEIPADEKPSNITRQKRIGLIEYCCGYPFIIENVGGFNVAMVTSGGVSLKEVNAKTMESRLVPGLYFAGEILDIDGDTGGYNIQAAFSTGYLAARAISDTA